VREQTKWALSVVAFVVTATIARRVGQFEMKDQAEKQIAVLQQRIDRDQETYYLAREDYHKLLKSSATDAEGDFQLGVNLGSNCASHDPRWVETAKASCKAIDEMDKTLKSAIETFSEPPKTENWRLQ